MPSIFSTTSSKKLYHEDTLTKKARTSLTNFFPGLKRKRSSLYSEDDDEIIIITKKKRMNTMTRLFQKITMVTTNKKKKQRQKKLEKEQEHKHEQKNEYDQEEEQEEQHIILEYESYKFEFILPVIECTNGNLDIIKEEESSIFDTKEGIIMEFPIPPLSSTTRRCRQRQGSCPARFHSLVISIEDSDEEELLTPCLSETNLLIEKIKDLNI